MKFEANCNLKVFLWFLALLQFLFVSSLKLRGKNLCGFFSASSHVSWAIVLNKLKNHLSKTGERTQKGLKEGWVLCFYLLVTQNDRIICHQVGTFTVLQPSIDIAAAAAAFSSTQWFFFCGFFLIVPMWAFELDFYLCYRENKRGETIIYHWIGTEKLWLNIQEGQQWR